MQPVWTLITDSVLLGFGLAMDAFSVSLETGLREPKMPKRRMLRIAGIFAGFQLMMQLIGWICVRTVLSLFQSLQKYIPWIAFGLLLFIGGKMIIEGIRGRESHEAERVGTGGLLLQGVATSIDALSVGFTMTELNTVYALAESALIGIVTFCICTAGVLIGRKAGTKISGKASVLGGLVLTVIGIRILISGG